MHELFLLVITGDTDASAFAGFVRQQAKYHEDFERARGRGFTPGLDDPSMERYQRANQMIAEAGYSKGMHPQAMEMDRRPGGIIVGQ